MAKNSITCCVSFRYTEGMKHFPGLIHFITAESKKQQNCEEKKKHGIQGKINK